MTKPRRGRRIAVTCHQCGRNHQANPAALLAQLADALNACADAGLPVKFQHGIAKTGEGYVLLLADGRWAPRTLIFTPFTPPDDGDDLFED